MEFVLKTLTQSHDPLNHWYLWNLHFESLRGDATIELKNTNASLGFNVGQHYEASAILAHIGNADS